MELIPGEIINLIFEKLDFKSKLQFQSTNSHYRDTLVIIDLCNIPKIYTKKLSDNILKQVKYHDITILYAGYNPKITNVSHLTNLRVLDASFNCGIDQAGIQGLNLVKFYLRDNPKITTVSHMTKLQLLHVGGNCKIDQAGIRDLNLIELNVSNNPKITNVSHLTKLQVLNANNNPNITNVSHMTNLQVLDASDNCGIDQVGIQSLNLIQLYARGNSKITNVSHMTKLLVFNADIV